MDQVQPHTGGAPAARPPSFGLIDRKPPRPAAILVATVLAFGLVYALRFLRTRNGLASRDSQASGGSGYAGTSAGKAPDDDHDDPSQIDTIALGDPADAPVPARRGDHVSAVHPTILISLPRSGDKEGLIPNTPAGRLLYAWLAAFNKADTPMLENSLPSVAPEASAAAQMELRRQTGGFNLLSAKEVQPGVLVFRLRDQTPVATEVLGTLQVRPGANPPAIATLSLRAVPPPENAVEPGSEGKSAPR